MGEPRMGVMARWTFYQRFIAEHVKGTDPRHVEAWMRYNAYWVALDGEGGFFFSEWLRNRVWHVDSAGIITTAVGGGPQVADCVPATEAFLGEPVAVALDERGLFVVDGDSNRIRVITR